MGIHHIQLSVGIRTAVCLMLGCTRLSSAIEEKKGNEGKVGEFTIKGQSSVNVDSEKPPLSIDIDENEPLKDSLATEQELYNKNPKEIDNLKELANNKQRSSFVILPKNFEFTDETIAHEFRPLEALEALTRDKPSKAQMQMARWEFKVADATGRIYLNYSGRGLPPASVSVPTQNDEGEIIRVGNPHSGVLSYWNPEGRKHTAITESFSLPGLLQRKEGSFSIHLSLDHIFGSKDTSLITAPGRRLLDETIDWIKLRNATAAPMQVTVYAKTSGVGDAQAKTIAETLVASLLRPSGSIKTQGLASGVGLDERIEVTVLSSLNSGKRK
mgnify:FL=1